MWKAVLAGTTALAIVGSSLVYAQERTDTRRPDSGPRWSAEDMNALLDARIAAIKAALKLSADQEKNWPAFEQVVRDLAKARQARMAAHHDQPRGDAAGPDLIERLMRRASAMTDRADNLKRLADAAKPLYESLDEGQKHRFSFLMRRVGPARMAFAARHERHEHERRGPDGAR
jgi:zinc resistance-associated protein